MTADDVLEILGRFETAGVAVWLDGGWGVDALLGEQTRPHSDLDLAVARDDLWRAADALLPLGFVHRPEEEPGLPARFVLRDSVGRELDIHPLVFDTEGNGSQELGGGRRGTYPAAGLEGLGSVGGRAVRCLTPELQLAFHLAYEPAPNDRHDMVLLAERFGLELPASYVDA